MSLILDGTNGLSDIDGSAATPAIRGTDANTGIFFPAADTIAFATAGTEDMRLDAFGTLGLGVTPSAWGGVYKAIQVGSTAVFGGNTSANRNYSSSNVYWNGSNYKYITTSQVTQFEQSDGAYYWLQAASGTAGNNITFTQAMTLDSSGNLLVGDTSAAGRVLAKSATSDGTTSAYVAKNSSGTILLDIISTGYFKTGVAGNSPYNNATGSGANVFVGSDGALFRSTSSLKYKTDIQDATFGIADVLKLRAVTYKGKGSSDGDKVFAGLIAEEVHNLGLTQFVQYADDGSPDALSYGNMVSLCVKAIQEQQALITQLQADVATLKGN
jgi:hypothetical protein